MTVSDAATDGTFPEAETPVFPPCSDASDSEFDLVHWTAFFYTSQETGAFRHAWVTITEHHEGDAD